MFIVDRCLLCDPPVSVPRDTELPDPFAKIVVGDTGQCHATEVLRSTLDPKWNQHFDL